MNLSELREVIRTKTGYPERGTSGTTRINNAINYSLRHMWAEMPEALLKEELRIPLVQPKETGTLSIVSDDVTSFLVTGHNGTLTDDGTLDGLWLEVKKGSSYVIRRVQDVRIVGSGAGATVHISTDKAWLNNTDTGLTYRIYAYEYPYPADVQKIRNIIINPETNPREMLETLFPEEMGRWKIGFGWRSTGRPQKYSRGDYFVLEPPHYTPQVDLSAGQAGFKWGYDSSGTEQTDYGVGGTFSYKVIHVWGRQDIQTFRGHKQARYMSASSPASDKVSTNWGGPAISISTPDIDYTYMNTRDSADVSIKSSGYEKWIFRARHEIDTTTLTTAGNKTFGGSNHPNVEKDEIYYLWRIIDGSTVTVYDRGDFDPVDRRTTIKDFHGHFHLRFDKIPDAAYNILMSVVRRPHVLLYDTDAPNLPPECFEALTELAASYLLGDRDGDLNRKTAYYASYLNELARLKRTYSFSGHDNTSFGDGLGTSPRFGVADYPVEEGT
jgi:hypothetical protein